MKLRSLTFELPNGGALELTPQDAEALYRELDKVFGKPDVVGVPIRGPYHPWRLTNAPPRLQETWVNVSATPSLANGGNTSVRDDIARQSLFARYAGSK